MRRARKSGSTLYVWRAIRTSATRGEYLIEPQAVLDGRSVDGNHEFRHRPHFRRKFVGAEFCNREGYSLIKRFRPNFNIMRDAVGVGRRDPASVHGAII
jgi:hypothetical protein